MTWNWQQPDWPNFRWDPSALTAAEDQLRLGAGIVLGAVKHLGEDDQNHLIVEAMSSEALTTSEIEGEILNRASVQSSIQRQLGLAADARRISPAEQGIAEVMVDLFRNPAEPLFDQHLYYWHALIAAGRRDLVDVARFRTSAEPMQIVSGPFGKEKVHFQAPPASCVPAEMQRFLHWFNRTAPGGPEPLPSIARAGIAHLYFESIHPFEDGNGRIGRALSEKALAQSFAQPSPIGLSTTLLLHRKSYYGQLEQANQQNEITPWLAWFAAIAVQAQQRTLAQVEFLIAKTRLLDRLRGHINPRQLKALLRIFREGPHGFQGGLSAANYTTITGSSPATTTRDLAGLVQKGALLRAGERKHARYTLRLTPDL